MNAKSENCAYTNYSAENRNCYLVVGGLGAEDCLYSYRVFYSSNCVDCYDLIRCQRCYQCHESHTLFDCMFCRNCQNSSGLRHCIDCIGCRDCYGCAGLRNKQFHIYNTQFSEEEYRKKISELGLYPSPAVLSDIRKLHLTVPRRFAQIIQSEGSTGDQLLECKDCRDCYTLKHSRDCRFAIMAENDKDCVDVNFCDNCELHYDSANLEKNYGVSFCSFLWYSKESSYTMNSFNSHHLFGCSGMKKHSYCILNTQYTKEEYEALVPRIIAHMRKTPYQSPASAGSGTGQAGEWGKYFPPSLSPFGYNETTASETAPLTKEEVRGRDRKSVV
jgi:hypothetical protein